MTRNSRTIGRDDPAALLARGFTARFTGFVSGSMLEKSHRQTSLLQPLSTEEIEKDLRHITAYETAVLRINNIVTPP